MGTRSRIAIENKDGTIESIYCHWDGYPSNNGKILKEHYTTEEKIRELINLGDLSSLGPEIGEQHPFDSRDDTVCTAYGRDRGEDEVDKVVSFDVAALSKIDDGAVYQYLYTKDGKWEVHYKYGNGGFVELTDELIAKD